MKILMVHNEYARPSGEEAAVAAISSLLDSRDHHVTTFFRTTSDIASFKDKVHAFFAGIHCRGAVTDLEATLSDFSPDIVQVQNLYPFISPSVLPMLKAHGLPIVMRCPNYRLFCPSGLHLSKGKICERCLGGREYWCALRNCEGSLTKSVGYAVRNAAARLTGRITDNISIFIVLSEFARQRFIEQGIPPERVEILPNIVPTISAPVDRWEAGEAVTFVGRISPEKGIDDFIEAARRLPHIPFVVAGHTEAMPDLPSRSPANVTYTGFLRGGELDEIYRRSRILVFPSRWFEGFPNVITHAMTMRKPVIATQLGAMPEIVDDGQTGSLYEAGNAERLTETIADLYDDLERCREYGNNGYEKAARVYSQEAVYQRLMEIYAKAQSLNLTHTSVAS